MNINKVDKSVTSAEKREEKKEEAKYRFPYYMQIVRKFRVSYLVHISTMHIFLLDFCHISYQATVHECIMKIIISEGTRGHEDYDGNAAPPRFPSPAEGLPATSSSRAIPSTARELGQESEEAGQCGAETRKAVRAGQEGLCLHYSTNTSIPPSPFISFRKGRQKKSNEL